MREVQHPAGLTRLYVLALWLVTLPGSGLAGSPSDGTPSARPPSPKDVMLEKYLRDCFDKPTKDVNCEKLRNQTVEILKEDLHSLGSTASRTYLPDILKMFDSDEAELRIAAADAIGMIGPKDSDLDSLIPLTNDPVPDVRLAVSNMLRQGKGSALALLKERVMPMRTGRTPDKPLDAAKFSMPLMPDSTYLFDTSDATKGRLSYLVRGKGDAVSYFKTKAKKGPYQWDQFKELYHYQIHDEDEALNQAQQAAGKHLESEQPPDPSTNMEAYVQYMQKLASVSTQGSMGRTFFDTYQSNLYGAPSVYVLEERQIGQRSYPTRYVVLYQELAFKRTGYRLAWTTVPDDALKAAQVVSLKEQREQEAHEAASKRDEEAAKKREAELESLTKKKDTAEKKQFKKGQDDLEKALGF